MPIEIISLFWHTKCLFKLTFKILIMLSIVIPSYNDAKNISLAIASADQIKYVNEIIVVDDCSTDNTEVLIKEIINCKKIKYFKNLVNKGSGLTFLKGLQNNQ